MARHIQLSLVFTMLFAATSLADEPKPAAVQVKVKPAQVNPIAAKPPLKAAVVKPAKDSVKPRVVLKANTAAGKLVAFNKASKAQTQATTAYAVSRADVQKLSLKVNRLKQLQTDKPNDFSAEFLDALKKELATAEKALLEAVKDSKAKQLAVVKAVAAAKKAAAQSVTLQRASVQPIVVRKEVNPDKDDTERFVLLLPGGPMLIEATMLLDGKSFRVVREDLITEMIKFADKDEDGKSTWAEAIKSPRFTMGRLRFATPQQGTSTINYYDLNKDGIVDRVEVRQFLARYFNGSAFSLTGGSYWGQSVVSVNGRVSNVGGRPVDVKPLLDTNKDGILSAEEIAVAGDRLKSRDADDNDLLYSNEVTGTPTGRGAYQLQSRPGMFRRAASLYYLIGPTVSSAQIHSVLTQIYKNSEGKIDAANFSRVPELFKKLDKNANGILEQNEASGLNSAKPHTVLQIQFNKDKGGKLTVDGVVAKNNSTSIVLPGVKVSFSANVAAARTVDYSQTAKSYFARYDGDKNGYLEKKELGNFARQFETWDIDADGKVFEKEIAESYALAQRPQQSQFRASVANQGNPLFQTLDISGDGRLSLREMRTASKQMLKFDSNKDGKIAGNEIPQTFAITFSRGNSAYSYSRPTVVRRGAGPGQPAANPNQPAWFTRMDRNGDGDITLKEFLGEKADFEKLDTNKDGFIEPVEAKKAASE
jgi:Ca2+-binding EF-hand superfamily protein